mgnify:CR=1 FL=1
MANIHPDYVSLLADVSHSVETVEETLQAVDRALGDRSGIARYGDAHVPLDEALTRVVIDVSGRPYLVYDVTFPAMFGAMFLLGSYLLLRRQPL